MSDFYRSLCADLIDALDSGILTESIRRSPLANRARAALTSDDPASTCKQSLPVASPPATEGEVAELVAALESDAGCAEAEHYDLCNMTADQMRRAAELLRQRHPTPEQAERPLTEGAPASSGAHPAVLDTYYEYIISNENGFPVRRGSAYDYNKALSDGQDCIKRHRSYKGYTLSVARAELLYIEVKQ